MSGPDARGQKVCGCFMRNQSSSVGGINTMNYPIDDFLGAKPGASSSVDGATTKKGRIVFMLVLAGVAYYLWHYSQTH